jgi:hypothetical protein
MSSVSDYYFNNLGHLSSDATDNTQHNLQNIRFGNYMLSDYFSANKSNDHVNFALTQPTMSVYGLTKGSGLNGSLIDTDSELILKKESSRPLEKLQLMQRPFLTVPFLGRGSCDTTLESQMLQGEKVSDKKSVSTIMSQSFMGYTLHPSDDEMNKRVSDTKHTVEESAMDGWVRGGLSTREMAEDGSVKSAHRPIHNL